MAQKMELGIKPHRPSVLTAKFVNGTLTIACMEGGKSIQFSVSIANIPAMLAYGMATIPIPVGVATITFNVDNIAAQTGASSRGQGLFYTLYGSGHSAGALMAWAWGAGRVLDALELVNTGIDPRRVGVTGCSRFGKGVMIAGAFEPRFALTIPQESGTGGVGCWRVADDMYGRGMNVQTARQIVTENVWFSNQFQIAYAQYANGINTLPFDHHMIAGLIAPRGLFVIENQIDWLGPESCYVCMFCARKIWQALGAQDSMGFSQIGGHRHCALPASQQPEVTAFITRFLLLQSANTDIFVTDGPFTDPSAQWCPWAVPTLS